VQCTSDHKTQPGSLIDSVIYTRMGGVGQGANLHPLVMALRRNESVQQFVLSLCRHTGPGGQLSSNTIVAFVCTLTALTASALNRS